MNCRKHLSYFLIFIAPWLLFLLQGCEKMGSESNMIEIFAEPFHGGAKVQVDGNNSTWIDGDSIAINGDRVAVERREGHAYIPYDAPLSVNRAVYPARMTTGSMASDNVTLTLPAIYHFKTDASGKQLLDIPMAARSTESNPLEFKHLTGALCFVVHNNGSAPLILQSLLVKSSKYQISGSRTFDFTFLESQSAIETSVASKQQVRMLFDTGYVLEVGATLNVMVPIAPVGSDNHFTINLRYHIENPTSSFFYNRSQPAVGADRSLLRNQLGYAGIELFNSTQSYISVGPLVEITNNGCQIYSQHDFILWHTAVNGEYSYSGGDYIEIPCNINEDIDMTDCVLTPIMSYRANLEGNGHTIKNLTLLSCSDAGSGDYVCGLFRNDNLNSTSNLILDNLSIMHADNNTGSLHIGSFYALAEQGSNLLLSGCTARIKSVVFTGSVSTGALYYGGLVGQLGKTATFSNCHVVTPINVIAGGKNIYWGGLVGYQSSKALTINNSTWTGTGNLDSGKNMWAGGLLGYKLGGNLTITNCQAQGAINATVGGSTNKLASLIGLYYTPATVSITSTTPAVTISLNGVAQSPVPQYN